jgi:hypothetical protein
MKFVVDRRTWYRGNGSGESKLLRTDGMRCCIGFVGKQCGIPDVELMDRITVQQVESALWPKWMQSIPPIVTRRSVGDAYGANDFTGFSDAEREEKLKRIFQANGDDIEFVN